MKKISIFIQLVLIMFVISAIPAISVIYVNSINMRKSSEEAVADSALNKIRANRALGDEMLTNIVYDALDLILAKQYVDLEGITSYERLNSDFKYVDAAIKMQGNLEDLSDRNKLVYSILYYMDNADYVISTDKGFVKLDSYDDMSWLKEAVPKIQGAEGIWYPRKIKTAKSGQESTVNLVSYCYRSSSLYTSAKGTVVINVYENELSNLIYSDSEVSGGEGFLMNGRGEVIAHSDNQYLYKNISDLEYVSKILKSGLDSGYGITDDRSLLYTFEKSELYDWRYVNVYSLEQLYSQSKQITRFGAGMTLLIILAGAVCAVFISFKISKPIRELADEIRGLNPSGDEEGETKNEIVYLSGAFGQIKEREKTLQDSLSQSEESIRRIGINNLIHGDSLQEKERNLVKSYFPYNHFMVVILATDQFQSYQAATTHEERRSHRIALYECIKKTFPTNYVVDIIRYNVSAAAIIINIKDYDSDQVKKEIQNSVRSVQACYLTETKHTLTAGISQVHNYLEGVKTCGDEAFEALKKRLILGAGNIVFFRKSKENGVASYQGYSHEKRIMNYLEMGDIEKIDTELQLMVENIRAVKDISVENIMLVFNQLTGSTLIYLNQCNINVAEVLGGDQSNLYLLLAELETMDEIVKFLRTVYVKIIEYQNAETGPEELDYVKIILRYIKQNYRQEINFEELSKEIGISYSYARKIVKEGTGKSLIDNLNLVRISEAKLLLESTDMTVTDISAAVGYNSVQSLYRFFKKYEGISASDYKVSAALHKERNESKL